MADVEFFAAGAAMTVAEIAQMTGAVPRAGAVLDRTIRNVAPIDLAGPEDLTFLESPRFADDLATTRAGAILLTARFEAKAPDGLTVLRVRAPYNAFVAVTREFYRHALRPASTYGEEGVAPSATIHPTARLATGVTVDPGAVIGAGVEIGAHSIIGANAVIGSKVKVGCDCNIGPTSSVTHSMLGDRVIIHPGCHIGQDGFGYVPGDRGLVKVPQVGRVVIHDDVEIGAGCKIDRGGIRDTVIGAGTKIDNLVQIGHNVTIGKNCIIVAQSGLSGSVTIEDNVVLAARVGIVPHVTVGKGAQLAARSTVLRDVPPDARWGGHPNAKPLKQWMREMVLLERLAGSSAKKAEEPAAQDD